jgi:antitoxin component YwqK of YwqJK toxin-antitoxin module
MTRPLTHILVLFILLTTLCNGQTTKEDKVLGYWELIESNQKIILYFQKDGTVDFEQNGQQFKADYTFSSDTTLLLGSTLYKVLTLSDKDLIIETTCFLTTNYHYQKTEKTVKSIQEYETVEETYQNGQKKVDGKYHNGFEDGRWTKWYENGQVKSIQNFKNGMPTGKQEFWYESGQKKEDKEFDDRNQLLYLKRWDEKGNLKEEIKN